MPQVKGLILQYKCIGLRPFSPITDHALSKVINKLGVNSEVKISQLRYLLYTVGAFLLYVNICTKYKIYEHNVSKEITKQI